MTSAGGSSNNGTVFSYNLSTNGYAVLHHFAGGAADGAKPRGALAVSGTKLYGMTEDGGTANQGTMFQYDTSNQSYGLLHSFAGGLNDGSSPQGTPLVSGSKLYGTTDEGGPGVGTLFEYDIGTSTYDVLYNFGTFGADAKRPNDSLVLVNNRLYGMSIEGGSSFPYGGTIFEYDLGGGTGQVLHKFGTPPDGESPDGSLFFDGAKFYGVTEYGGTSGNGMIFSLDLPEPSAAMMLAVAATAKLLHRRRRS
jgi:uncharacterized repeat protein (TIGR03803 family)